MNLYETYRYMALLWENPKEITGFRDPTVYYVLDYRFGLCGTLRVLHVNNLISTGVFTTISRDIDELQPTPASGPIYKWPTTKEGTKQRVAWCLQMADKYRKEGLAHP